MLNIVISMLLALMPTLINCKLQHTVKQMNRIMKKNKYNSKQVQTLKKMDDIDDSDTIYLSPSCDGLEDGLHYIRPFEDAQIIPVICSNRFIMIDLSLNFEALTSYFTSWEYSRSDPTVIGPELDDFSTWREWWTLADENTQFRPASNCHKCYSDFDHADNGAFYMSSYYFCFSTAMASECVNGESAEGYELACSYCDDGMGNNDVDTARSWIKCTSLRFDADTVPNNDHYNCVTHSLVYRPSAVITRDACTCYKPDGQGSSKTYAATYDELPAVTLSDTMDDDMLIDDLIVIATEDTDNDDIDVDFDDLPDYLADLPVYYISQEDCVEGTYRITEPGNYVITQDIVFAFNAPSEEIMKSGDWSPNTYETDDLYWYPRHDQEDDYPGLYTFHGKYALGYFAGLSIETNNVVINLNGHSLSMDYKFYFQQRFFSLIELGNQPFLAGQGPANWGSDSVFASNIIIKDGTLGKSSHHSIHGNMNTNLIVSNVRMTEFDVAGLGCNACNYVSVEDCIIGPQNTNIPVLGRYTHARAFVPRIRNLVDNFGEDTMKFFGRDPQTVTEYADRLINQMDMIYFNQVDDVEYDDDDEEWIAAKKLFLNPTGWMDGGSSYGMVFNGVGAAVIGIGCRTDGTSNINIENVEVYGIYTNPIEKPKFQSSGAIRLSFFDGLDWPAVTDQLDDVASAVYLGDAYTDLVFTVNHYIESWYYLNSLRITPPMSNFVLEGDAETFAAEFEGICGSDIQLHSSKGAIGIRFDGVQDITMNGVYVHDIQNWGDLGISLCGEYDTPTVSHEDPQIQYGYTGNRAQGIIASYASGVWNDVTVENVESYHGSAWGMTLYKGNEIAVSDVAVQSIYAGTKITTEEADALILPNMVPLACSVEIREEAVITSTSSFIDVTGNDVLGHTLCSESSNHFGDVLGSCDGCAMYSDPADNGDNDDDDDDEYVDVPDDSEIPSVDIPQGSVAIYSACNALEDGIQYILPYGTFDEEQQPLLPVVCHDGATTLDPSLSFEIYEHYFTSLYMYDIGIAGPSLDDFASWRSWYLPEANDDHKQVFKYGISDDCSSQCAYSGQADNAYYMTGNFYLCAWVTKGDCDMDAETYQCYTCARHGGRSMDVFPGVCSHLETQIDYAVHEDHFQCTGNNDNLKPSIGLGHQFCACYEPRNEHIATYVMDEEEFNDRTAAIAETLDYKESDDADTDTDGDVPDGTDNIVYLTNDDFLYGTYRITEPGVYILTEDIVLNFNAPDAQIMNDLSFSPNSYSEFHWMPKTDGSQEDKYMGSSTWSGPYQLGFFTGVTIETSNVVIDLGGHEIGMSEEFYLQQRVFSIFEMAAKNFVAGQGPVDFGPFLNSAENVVIKNGIIGRASHHGIHANDAKAVVLDNLVIRDFDVAGIQLNGFDDITISNCEIGPSSTNIPVTGRYLHARVLLRRFAHLVDNYGQESFAFADREERTVAEYVDELISQMDMVYDHVINGVEYADDDETWIKVQDLFINPNQYGYGDGGVVYGILLNSRGGAVMGFGNAPSQSTNANIENVYIHDLAISPIEKLKFKTNPLGGATRGPVADVMDIMKVADQFDDVSTSKYIGTAYSDVQIAMSLHEKSWYVLDHTCFDEGIVAWAVDGTPFGAKYYGGCNTDIQLHINKGVIGLRIDNVVDFTVSNVNIESLVNTGVLGTETDVCGAYTQGNAHQDPLITAGYTGTEGYGITITQSTAGKISDTAINNVETYYGMSNGIALFKDSSVDFSDVTIDNIIAGSKMELDLLRPEQAYLPNKIPIACSIYDNSYNTEYTMSGDVSATNVNGFLLCQAENLVGSLDDETNEAQYDRDFFEELTLEAVENSESSEMSKKTKKLSVFVGTFRNAPKTTFIVIAMIVAFAFLACNYWFGEYERIADKKKIIDNMFASEKTPLIIH